MVAATVPNEENYRHQTNLPMTADAPEHAPIEGKYPPAALDVIAETCYEVSGQAMGVAQDHLKPLPGKAPARCGLKATGIPLSHMPSSPGCPDRKESTHMDERHANAREQFFAAIRTLAASVGSIQTRVIDATQSILQVTIDEFEGDSELKIKFARLLDLLAVDDQDDLETAAVENAAHMTDFEAVRVADLICDFYYDLG
jgi:hypothetical protein